jgi:hypothetical protein
MAIGAASVKEKHRRIKITVRIIGYRHRLARSGRDGVLGNHVALRTHSGVSDFQQPIVDRTVRLMTIVTVFKHRRVLM